MSAKRIAIANHKGGVGKTSLTLNAGAILAEEFDQKVLLIDIDKQANLSRALGFDPLVMNANNVLDVLQSPKTWDRDEVIRKTKVRNLYLIGSSIELANVEIMLRAQVASEFKLHAGLRDLFDEFDWILIDCPPDIDELTNNAFVAAEKVVIPVQLEFFALTGCSTLQFAIANIQEALNPDLQLLGAVGTFYDSRINLSQRWLDELNDFFGGKKTFETYIRRNVRVAESPERGEPISHYDKKSAGYADYLAFTKELIAKYGED